MNSNTILNVSCDFNGYLVCQMPADTVEIELKIKTKRGKYTLHKDISTRTERYHPWKREDKRSEIHTKRRAREVKSEVTRNSETDIQMGKGFAYPLEIFTNPEFAKTVPFTDMDCKEIEVEVTNPNFMGEFCSECIKKYNRCWCFKSDWEDDLIDIETHRVSTKTKANISQQLTVTVMPKRQPTPGWAEFRRHVTKKNKDNEPIDKLIIKGIKCISMQEFEEM